MPIRLTNWRLTARLLPRIEEWVAGTENLRHQHPHEQWPMELKRFSSFAVAGSVVLLSPTA
ncbi:MAG TPA: hypothetical protein VJ809_13130, partial [Pirellulales bacterium]|nr:hypothetical protein [Pirellulales bacterium]